MSKHAAVVFAAACIAAAQPSTLPDETKPAVFDVAAIRPSDLSAPRDSCYMKGQPGGQTFTGRCIPVRLIIKYAYKIIDSQIVGAPSWIDNELYDFEAKSDHPVTRADVAAMFQQFLADRFRLHFHRESRTMSAFVLSVDKPGVKMNPNTSTYEWDIPVQPIPGKMAKVKGIRCPLNYLSWWIAQRQDRPVIDKTGLDGFWDFTLEFAREAPPGAEVPEGPSFTTALREQLGLKLEASKAPVEIYVIDHVERATDN